MTELTVSAGTARSLLNFAESRGANREALVARSGLDPLRLGDQDNRVPFATYVRLMRVAKDLAGDPALALHFGAAIDLSEFSIVGLIGRACETAMEGFAQLNRYARLVVEVDTGIADRFRFAHEEGDVWLIDNRPNPNEFPELTESTFARMASGMRQFGETPLLKEVHVTHDAPSHQAEYQCIFRAPVVFQSDKNAMLIDPAILNHRIALAPRYVFGILSEHADELLDRLEKSKSMRGRVESLMLPVLHTGDIGIEAIAAKLSISRWTLSRRLKAEGTTFEQVLDALRHKLALSYLSGKKVSVSETAYLIGFSEPAAFSRAFKRWTGVSPSAARTLQSDPT